MKIAIIVCRFKPYKGGISNMAYDQALGLAKLGHQVTVFTPLYGNEDNTFQSSSFKIFRLKPWLKYGNAAWLPQLYGQLNGFDIIHLHYPFFGASETVWLFKLLKSVKTKLVITYHMDVFGTGFLKLIFSFNTKVIMPLILKSADKVIVTSFDYAVNSNIKSLIHNNEAKYIAIPPSVDLARFYPADKDYKLVSKYLFDSANDRILLFVGALDAAHYFKGLDFLLNSFPALIRIMPQLKLLIVGGGEWQAKYEKIVNDNNLETVVKFSGSVSDFDLPKYYNLADLVILPSIDRSEAFGITLVEAMACAKPIIAADLPGVRSVFTNGIEGLVFSPKEELALAGSLAKIINDDTLRLQMGQNARQKALNSYNQDNLIIDLERVYSDLLNK